MTEREIVTPTVSPEEVSWEARELIESALETLLEWSDQDALRIAISSWLRGQGAPTWHPGVASKLAQKFIADQCWIPAGIVPKEVACWVTGAGLLMGQNTSVDEDEVLCSEEELAAMGFVCTAREGSRLVLCRLGPDDDVVLGDHQLPPTRLYDIAAKDVIRGTQSATAG
jgi:hypothetical protein